MDARIKSIIEHILALIISSYCIYIFSETDYYQFLKSYNGYKAIFIICIIIYFFTVFAVFGIFDVITYFIKFKKRKK